MPSGRQLTVTGRYLNLPVTSGAPKRFVRLTTDGRAWRQFEMELAEGEPDFWVVTDVRPLLGRRLTISADGLDAASPGLKAVFTSDHIAGSEDLYRERHRPQFHFTAQRGWNNDPNGLVFHDGEYHLFYQHNPYGCTWGNMHWAHAVSTDLVHWRELGDALYPDRLGTVFSGSGVVDVHNTAGFRTGDEQVMVCIYTSAGSTSAESEGQPCTQSVAYSNDCGRSWLAYAGNPVLGHVVAHNRDPKVIWHEPSGRWVMALYLDQHDYALFTSPDLKTWTRAGDVRLPGCTECPDLFELPLDGDPGHTRWVFWGADGSYLVGTFDGTQFQPEGKVLAGYAGGNAYAAQTWSHIPSDDGRRIQIAWLRADVPGMPFNQGMTFPCELTLQSTRDGARLFFRPVREIETLYDRTHRWHDLTVGPGDAPLADVTGDLFDIRVECTPPDAGTFGLVVRGVPISYDAGERELSCLDHSATLQPDGGRIRLQVLVDRTSIEIFGNGGRVYMPIGVVLQDDDRSLHLASRRGSTKVHDLEVRRLRPAWV